MKKKDILKVIEATDILNKYKDFRNIEKYPNIPELKTEFELLKEELEEIKEKIKESKKTLDNIKCDHQVRMQYRCFIHSNNECVLCGNIVPTDNYISFNHSNYRNNYTVTFLAKNQEGDFGEKYTLKMEKQENNY